MPLSQDELDRYRHDGYVLLDQVLDEAEVRAVRAAAEELLAVDVEQRILEEGSGAVRSVYDAHRRSRIFSRLVTDRRLLETAERVLGSQVYIHQTQLNPKAAFDGEHWDWHQDFLYWQRDDGMPAPRATNVVVYVDDMTMYNGPLFLIPGSHELDLTEDTRTVVEGWEATLTREMKHVLSRSAIASAAARGLCAPLGPAGSVLLFDPRILHASPANISPFQRSTLFVRYNSVENALLAGRSRRPSWLAERNPTPLVARSGGLLDDVPLDLEERAEPVHAR